MAARSRAGDPDLPVGDPSAGYLLIEMTAALALTVMLIGIAFPLISTGTSASRFTALATATVSLLRDARTSALSRGAPVAASFDSQRRLLQGALQTVAVPRDVELSLTTGGNCPSSDRAIQILFRPDGTNCGGVLRLARAQRVLRIRVDWVTGRIDVLDGG